MTREAFDQLVASLESRYRGKQPALVRRAMTFAVIGYVGLAVFLLTGFGLVLGLAAMVVLMPNVLTIKIGLVVGIPAALVTWAILRGLWVRLHPPEGIPILRAEAPELFAVINRISDQAGGVRFDEVLLTNDLNAAVVQVPRLGVFGWYRTYLLLGLPLMDALSADEFQSVIAHEFAHLSHQHGRLGSWLYRLRASWERVIASLAEGGVPAPVRGFIGWFWPRFNASAFVLSRSQEYQADAFGASVTSPAVSARALQRLVIESRRLDETFWEGVGRATAHEPQAPADVFHRMHAFFGTEADRPLATRWLTSALAMQTDTVDTHPALKDRLAALGVAAVVKDGIPPAGVRASAEWLSEGFAGKVRDQFSREWHEFAAPRWEVAHREKQELRKKLGGDEPAASVDEEFDRISARANLEGPESIQGLLVEFLSRNPDHLGANYGRGVYLAGENDLSAVPFLEKIAAHPPSFHSGLGPLAGLYDRLGMAEEVTKLKRRADEYDREMSLAMGERNKVLKSDHFHRAELSPESLASLLAVLDKHPKVTSAWVVRKQTQRFTDWLHYVIVVEIHRPAFGGTSDHGQILQAIVDEFSVDGYVLAIAKSSETAGVVKAIAKIDGALIRQTKK